MEVLINNVENLAALGLFWDGLGVLILGATSVFKAKTEIALESGQYIERNPHELLSKVASRMDISMGSLFLFFGFFFQFLGALSVTATIEMFIFMWLAAPLLALYYYVRGRGQLINRWLREINS